MRFDPIEIVSVLLEHDVTFVLIGGVAAAMHGYDGVTTDLDITPADDTANLDRLSAALRQLEAGIRVDGLDEPLPFDHDGESLRRATVWSLRTCAGDLDIALRPDGTTGYADLRTRSLTITIAGLDIELASLADIIRSKEAADRPKDRLALPALRALHDRDRGGGPPPG